MVDDARCLSDLLVRDLQPVLGPLLEEKGFAEAELGELNGFEQTRLRDIDAPPSRRDWRDSNDRLLYQEGRMLVQVRPYPSRASTLYDIAHPFGLLFRYDLEEEIGLNHDGAVRLIPSNEAFQKIRVMLSQKHARGVYIGRADELRNSLEEGIAFAIFSKEMPGAIATKSKSTLFCYLGYGGSQSKGTRRG